MTQTQSRKKNLFQMNVDLMHGPIFRSLVLFMLPILVSNLFQQLYNTVDTMIVGNVLGDTALAAIGSCGSIYELLVGFGIGIGNGLAIVAARSYGAQDEDLLKRTVVGSVVIGLIASLVITTAGFFGLHALLQLLDTPAEILEDAYSYIIVIDLGVVVMFMYNLCAGLLRAIGNSVMPLVFLLISSVLNVGLDLWFIAGVGMGVRGAAVATVIGQFCGAGMTLYFNTRKNPDIQISFKGFRPSAKAIGRIYTVGLPSIAMQCVGSLMTFGMNLILMTFSATAVAVFGVYFKLQSFVFMPIFGLNNGMVPIISYNYGARRPDRVKKTIKLAVCYAECIMLIGFCIFQFAPDKVLGIFAASDAMLAIGIPALRIICPHFLLAGIGIVMGSDRKSVV